MLGHVLLRGEIDASPAQVAAARALLPFQHPKVADKGKKETKREAAKEAVMAGGNYAPLPPPRLAATGGKPV
ncbi:MAG: hypothetical protein LBE78_02910 [Burkholderiaceae bacterium]|jgi:phage terminase small subunit|nr:hypothetical protein [Burkholderiaceae bacterium]